MYRFLSFDVGAYLPSYDTVTVWHLRDLAMGRKIIIKANEVRTIQVPHFEGLSIKIMLQHSKAFPGVAKALPDEKIEIDKLLRHYIANIIYTIVGEPFYQWVQGVIKDRNDRIKAE